MSAVCMVRSLTHTPKTYMTVFHRSIRNFMVSCSIGVLCC